MDTSALISTSLSTLSSTFSRPYDEIEKKNRTVSPTRNTTSSKENQDHDKLQNTSLVNTGSCGSTSISTKNDNDNDNEIHNSPFTAISNLVSAMSGSLLLGGNHIDEKNKENLSDPKATNAEITTTKTHIIQGTKTSSAKCPCCGEESHDKQQQQQPQEQGRKDTLDFVQSHASKKEEEDYDNMFGCGFSQSFDGDLYKLQKIVAEGWVHLKGSGQDWLGSRAWKPRYAKLALSSVVGYETTNVPLLLIYWYQHSKTPSTIIVLDSTVVVPLDKPDKENWNAYCLEIIHTTSSVETTTTLLSSANNSGSPQKQQQQQKLAKPKRITRVMTAGTREARNAWVFNINQTMIQYEKEKHLIRKMKTKQLQQKQRRHYPNAMLYEDRFVSSHDILHYPKSHGNLVQIQTTTSINNGEEIEANYYDSLPQVWLQPKLSLESMNPLQRGTTARTSLSAPTSPVQQHQQFLRVPKSPTSPSQTKNKRMIQQMSFPSSPPLSPITKNRASGTATTTTPPRSPTSPKSFIYHPRTSAFTPPPKSPTSTMHYHQHDSIVYYHHRSATNSATKTITTVSTTDTTPLSNSCCSDFTPVSPPTEGRIISPSEPFSSMTPIMLTAMLPQRSPISSPTSATKTSQVRRSSSTPTLLPSSTMLINATNNNKVLLSPPSIRNTHLHSIGPDENDSDDEHGELAAATTTTTITSARPSITIPHNAKARVQSLRPLDDVKHSAKANPLLLLPQDSMDEEEDHSNNQHDDDDDIDDNIYTDDEEEEDLTLNDYNDDDEEEDLVGESLLV